MENIKIDSNKLENLVKKVFEESEFRSFISNFTTDIDQYVKNIIETGTKLINEGLGNVQELSDNNVAALIDHTILKPEALSSEVTQLCKEAKEYSFASVCVNPGQVKLASTELKDSEVKVCTVVGFPLGATTTETKKFETEQTIANGAQEVDMVINVGKLKERKYDIVANDIKQVVFSCQNAYVLSKVILETCLLTDEEKIKACLICKEAGADFVKTSTGFSKSGATAEDIALMRYIVGSELGVKASGGVRTRKEAETMIACGANRIGASASIKIVKNEKNEATGY